MSVSAGRYTIRLASDPSRALVTPSGSQVAGQGVLVAADPSQWLADWSVQARADGTWRVVSERAGKSMGGGPSPASGGPVRLDDAGVGGQAWDLAETGETVSYGGATLGVVTMALHGSALGVATSGSRAVLGAPAGLVLVPPPAIESGGAYQIRSMLKTSMCVAVSSSSDADGANVLLYSKTGSNGQKFVLVDEGDGWSIRPIASQKRLAVSGSRAASGTNVIQWSSTNSRGQRWKITETGDTVTIDGVTCPVVTIGSYVTTDGATYVLDVKSAMTTNSANVQIDAASTAQGHRFALLPTQATDGRMPAPSDVGLATEVGGPALANVWAQGTVYPTWSCPTSWASSGANHYEWRWASRTLGASGSWSAWSSFGAWAPAAVVVEGDRAWVADGLPGTVSGKALQYQIQVRAVGAGATSGVHSSAASKVVQVNFVPTVEVEGLTWTRDGLRLDYSSDYAAGTLDLDVRSVTSLGLPIVAEPHRTGFVDPSGSATIPVGDVNAFPSDGSVATVLMAVSTDVARSTAVLEFEDVPVTVPAGTIALGLEAGSVSGTGGLPVTTDVAAALTLVAGGRAYPLGTGTEWEVPFPYDEPFEVRAYATSGADWGVETLRYPHGVTAPARAHGWLGASGLVTLALRRDEDPELAVDATAEPSRASLAGRSRPSVWFGTAVEVQRPVAALLVEGETATWDEVRALVGTRCLYRAPYGGVARVAVTGAHAERTLRATFVTIDQEEVDQ